MVIQKYVELEPVMVGKGILHCLRDVYQEMKSCGYLSGRPAVKKIIIRKADKFLKVLFYTN